MPGCFLENIWRILLADIWRSRSIRYRSQSILIVKGLSQTDHLAVSFETCLRNGAFPATALSDDEQLIQTINQGLFDSIFTRDIILRGQIREPGSFMKVAKFLFENIGSQVSANNIANSLKAAGSSIKADTVDLYLTLMCDAFMLYPCDRYDLRGRARLKTNGKYYVVDTGIRNQLIGVDHSNKGHVLENVVFLELLRRGYQVFTGKNGAAEIDFMVQKGNQKFYIQVAWSIMDEQSRTREFSAFNGIQDVFPRYVMTLDTFDFSEQGIVHLNVFEFLLGKKRYWMIVANFQDQLNIQASFDHQIICQKIAVLR